MKPIKFLVMVSAATLSLSSAVLAQTTSATPGQAGGGGGAGSPHAKMITDKGYTMSDRMQKMNGYTTYWVMKGGKPWHVKMYEDGRMTEHEGETPSGG